MNKKIAVLLVFVFIFSFFAPLKAFDGPEDIASEAYVLMDADTGQVLCSKNPEEKMYPASITKIMTGILALLNGSLESRITMTEEAVFSIGRDTSHIALDTGEEITLEQAMYAMTMESANDASNGIAELIAGSMDSFADMMNEKAAEIGAENTHFANAHGLHDEQHYTTALDMAKITRYGLSVPLFTQFFGAKKYEIPPTNKQEETRYFASRNSLINGEIECGGVLMSKNGWTNEAKNTLVTVCERDGKKLIAVVMKSIKGDDKYYDTAKLMDMGFDSFKEETIPFDNIEKSIPDTVILESGSTAEIDKSALKTENIAMMIPSDGSADDLSVAFGQAEIKGDYALLEGDICYKGTPLENTAKLTLSLPLSLEAEPEAADAISLSAEPEDKGGIPWLLILIPVFVIVGSALLFARHMHTKRVRRMRRLMRMRRR